MLMSQQRPTPYDVKYRLFGIPHRINPLFYLGSAIIVWPEVDNPAYWLIAFLCVCVNIMIHELGHGLAFKRFRAYPVIEFGFLYGVTIPNRRLLDRWKRVVVTLAGPVTGLLFAATVYASEQAFPLGGTEKRHPGALRLPD